MKVMQGLGIAPGIAVGPAFIFDPPILTVSESRCADPQQEKVRLAAALQEAGRQIDQLLLESQQELSQDTALIFETQKLFLADPDLLTRVNHLIGEERFTAEFAWHVGIQQFETLLSSLQVEVFAERSIDLHDIGQRVLRVLLGKPLHLPLSRPSILFADDLTPSIIVGLNRTKLLAFCTAQGSPTSHVAILSKAMGIPAVSGIHASQIDIHNGQAAILDGVTGTVILDPEPHTVHKYSVRSEELQQKYSRMFFNANTPAVMKDLRSIMVTANLNSIDEANGAFQSGADGVGLFRTEYLFFRRKTPPSEEEQYRYYVRVLQQAGEKPVTFRTLDLGGDKSVEYCSVEKENNPFLGMRGTRLALKHRQLLFDQLCALLRAGVYGKMKVMFPFVSTMAEVWAIIDLLEDCKSELSRRGMNHADSIPFGIMIETPASALLADMLLQDFDFCSIGTNDLVQYTMAADRTNPAVAAYIDALDPSVIRLIEKVIDTAHRMEKPVSLCGEMAGDPIATPLLLGLHLDEFSLNASGIPLIKDRIRSFSLSEAEQIVLQVKQLQTAADVRKFLLFTENHD